MPTCDLLMTDLRLFTRYEHGNDPVRVIHDERGRSQYELRRRDGSTTLYSSARRLISEVAGRNMSFDRYFKIGRHRRRGRPNGSPDLLVLLDQAKQTAPIVVPGPRSSRRTTGVVIDEYSTRVQPLLEVLPPLAEHIEPPPVVIEEFDRAFRLELDRLEELVGIDLAARSKRKGAQTIADEVRRLLWAGFAGKMLSQGYDPQDVLQEVYRGLVVRNRGKCPWDRRKSTFGHYVHMVISCVLTNHHRKQVRRADRDAVSLESDVQLGGSCPLWYGSEVGDNLALQDFGRYLDRSVNGEAALGRRILPYVGAGYSRSEIAKELGTQPSNVSRALTWLRRQAAQWAEETGMQGHIPLRYRAHQ